MPDDITEVEPDIDRMIEQVDHLLERLARIQDGQNSRTAEILRLVKEIKSRRGL